MEQQPDLHGWGLGSRDLDPNSCGAKNNSTLTGHVSSTPVNLSENGTLGGGSRSNVTVLQLWR